MFSIYILRFGVYQAITTALVDFFTLVFLLVYSRAELVWFPCRTHPAPHGGFVIDPLHSRPHAFLLLWLTSTLPFLWIQSYQIQAQISLPSAFTSVGFTGVPRGEADLMIHVSRRAFSVVSNYHFSHRQVSFCH